MNRLTLLAAASLVLGMAPPPLLAQDQPAPPRLMRGDISGTVGWVSLNKSDVRSYNDWHSQFGVSGGAGWYWTDHHKTQVEVAATTAATVYSSQQIVVAPQQQTFLTTVRNYESQRVSLTQLYQFRRNEWVHPFLGAGLDIVREQSSRRDDPAYWYDPISRQSRLARETGPARQAIRGHGPRRPDRRGQGLLLEKGVRADRSAGRHRRPTCRGRAVAVRPGRRLLARLRLRPFETSEVLRAKTSLPDVDNDAGPPRLRDRARDRRPDIDRRPITYDRRPAVGRSEGHGGLHPSAAGRIAGTSEPPQRGRHPRHVDEERWRSAGDPATDQGSRSADCRAAAERARRRARRAGQRQCRPHDCDWRRRAAAGTLTVLFVLAAIFSD